MNDKRRFATLDGLRGIAAVLVMLYHAGKSSPLPIPGGYLAVDLFFALSGFVLALAYEPRLRSGYSFREFAIRRLVRIYPMYLAGAVIGAVLVSGIVAFNVGTVLLLPDFRSRSLLYPANAPMWSLLFELVVNLIFALCAMRVGWRGLMAILAASGGMLVHAALQPGHTLNYGAFWGDGVIYGLFRTIFSFTLGVGVYRLRSRLGLRRRETWLAWMLFPVLIAALVINPAQRTWWDLACVFAILPALLWLGTLWEAPRARLAEMLGDISYPLYCIHAPVVWLGIRQGGNMALLCALIILAAWALDRFVDRPARARLGELVNRQFAKPAPA